MSNNVYFVFSKPPDWLAGDEFDTWREVHMDEVLAVDGFPSARRFHVQAVVGTSCPTMYSHLTIYGIDGDPADTLARLEREIEAGSIVLPDWIGEARFASFVGKALAGHIVLGNLDRLYVIFSQPPAGTNVNEYDNRSTAYIPGTLPADAINGVWSYALKPDVVDALAPCKAIHGAVYGLDGDVQLPGPSLADSNDGHGSEPDWLRESAPASVVCVSTPHAIRD